MPKLSRDRFRRTLLFVLVSAVVLFFINGPDYYSARSFKSIWDQGHIIFYTLLFYYLLRYFPLFGSLSFGKQLSWGLLITISSGVFIELVQIKFERLPEIADVWRDCLGCILALIYFSSTINKIPMRLLKLLRILIIFFIILELAYPIKALIDERTALKQFPLLSGFETIFETDRWEPTQKIKRVKTYSSEGKYSAEIFLTTKKYSGIALKYFPGNWENYSYLCFSVYNPLNQDLEILGLVHDREYIEKNRQSGDRFQKKLILSPGWNAMRISLTEIQKGPINRFINLQKILTFGLYVSDLKIPQSIYLDEVRLE